ncbi:MULTISPECIES: hypothetical protein [Aequorivita]|uniref:Tetrahaem cytochrome domain-containing protein n=1 Tax=Aequorivita iocasae TaxID=2803865 RepID=A0ABX7DVA0_9FLAO|nr:MULTISPECIES: hypothetical protein [Aequorivita]QQX78096.1 hypothetical protein JK629_07515 [Aequorivita iocasae]UCA57605.1 hypothetical protein LDL78_07560 [Aequorivita sp. F7]
MGQSPHGTSLKIDCSQCHNPEGWTVDLQTIKFDHSTTNFDLEGTHQVADCKSCHTSMVFNEAPSDCISCHTDVHSQSVGNDCVRCHTSENWLVFNIPEIHEENGFPLIGSHSNLSCVECHSNESSLIFNPLGNECIECHRNDYLATQNPNHSLSGFSQDCIECHNPLGLGWDSTGIIHDFFPLTLGHDIQDCSQCHDVTNFSNISADCFSCHDDDFAQTTNPNHTNAGFSTDCVECHTTNPGWVPATINHDFFPLTLGHDVQDCNACHINGNFNNTPTDCFACHDDDYNQTTNPNHIAANFPTDCVVCHTTNPGWQPATINHDFFPLTLGHDIQDCNACHINGNYNNTPTDCFACHEDDYNQTTDPNHIAANFPTDCASCHTTNPGWTPATFDHDNMYFPIYSGKHEGEWNSCVDCHTNPNDYSTFSCFLCHSQGEMDDEHDEVNGYIYESNACFACHPDGSAD